MAIDLAEKLDPRHTALIIVDVQNDFCHSDGTFGQRGFDMSAARPGERAHVGLRVVYNTKQIPKSGGRRDKSADFRH